MRTPEFRETERKLEEAERAGNAALRQAAAGVMETHACDSGFLEELAQFCGEKAYSVEDEELSSTWMFLMEQVWDYACKHLSREEYHRFCEAQKNGIKLY